MGDFLNCIKYAKISRMIQPSSFKATVLYSLGLLQIDSISNSSMDDIKISVGILENYFSIFVVGLKDQNSEHPALSSLDYNTENLFSQFLLISVSFSLFNGYKCLKKYKEAYQAILDVLYMIANWLSFAPNSSMWKYVLTHNFMIAQCYVLDLSKYYQNIKSAADLISNSVIKLGEGLFKSKNLKEIESLLKIAQHLVSYQATSDRVVDLAMYYLESYDIDSDVSNLESAFGLFNAARNLETNPELKKIPEIEVQEWWIKKEAREKAERDRILDAGGGSKTASKKPALAKPLPATKTVIKIKAPADKVSKSAKPTPNTTKSTKEPVKPVPNKANNEKKDQMKPLAEATITQEAKTLSIVPQNYKIPYGTSLALQRILVLKKQKISQKFPLIW
jgi:hypothetical protein